MPPSTLPTPLPPAANAGVASVLHRAAGVSRVVVPAVRNTSPFADGLIEHQALFGALMSLSGAVHDTAERLGACLSTGGKLLVCGHGSSGVEAQLMANSLSGRLVKARRPLAAMALSADAGAMNCIAADLGYDEVFARQVHALARAGDALLVISAQPAGESLLRAVHAAREDGLLAVGLMAPGNEPLARACHIALVLPPASAVRLQEAQQFIVHTLCTMIETSLGLD